VQLLVHVVGASTNFNPVMMPGKWRFRRETARTHGTRFWMENGMHMERTSVCCSDVVVYRLHHRHPQNAPDSFAHSFLNLLQRALLIFPLLVNVPWLAELKQCPSHRALCCRGGCSESTISYMYFFITYDLALIVIQE